MPCTLEELYLTIIPNIFAFRGADSYEYIPQPISATHNSHNNLNPDSSQASYSTTVLGNLLD